MRLAPTAATGRASSTALREDDDDNGGVLVASRCRAAQRLAGTRCALVGDRRQVGLRNVAPQTVRAQHESVTVTDPDHADLRLGRCLAAAQAWDAVVVALGLRVVGGEDLDGSAANEIRPGVADVTDRDPGARPHGDGDVGDEAPFASVVVPQRKIRRVQCRP